eukprot:scaffold3803_cov151-Skeletonema_menzelii.AAC.7
MTPTAATEGDDEPQQLNIAQHDNSDATTNNSSNESDWNNNNNKNNNTRLQQQTAALMTPSVPTTQTSIKAATARRQSLRSYLQNVSLSGAIIPQQQQHSDSSNPPRCSPEMNKVNMALSNEIIAGSSSKQQYRRRRLEVMGLLQHLKIHRYEDTTPLTVGSNSNHNTHSLSGGSLENDTSHETNCANNDTNGMIGNSATYIAGDTNHTSSSRNNTHSNAVGRQRCLLHPTVRMRNDKCSLCCALAKTLEVRRAKQLNLKNGVSDDDSVAMKKGGDGNGGTPASSLGDREDNVGDFGANEDCVGRGDDNKNKNGSNSNGKDGNSNKRNELEDDGTESKGTDASPGGLTEETAVELTIANSSIADVTECLGEEGEDDSQWEHDNHHVTLLMGEKQLETRDAEPQPEEEIVHNVNSLSNEQLPTIRADDISSSTIVAAIATKTTREVETAATSIHNNNDDDQVPQSLLADGGELQHHEIHGDNECSFKEARPATTTTTTTTVPLTKLQRTIALAKGALDSNKSRQQRDEQQQNSKKLLSRNLFTEAELKMVPLKDVSSYELKRRNDVVVRRSSPCGSHGSDATQPLSYQEEVVVPTTTATSSSSDASVKSASDSPPLTSLAVGNNSRGSNALGKKLGTSRLSSKALGDDDDNIDSKPCQASKMVMAMTKTIIVPAVTEDNAGDSTTTSSDREDSRAFAFDTKPGGVDRDVVVSPPTHATTNGKSSNSITGSDPKNKGAVQSANIVVEDVYSYSDEEDEGENVFLSTKTDQMQSRPKAVDVATKSNEQEEIDEDWIDCKSGTNSLGTLKGKQLEKLEDSATGQSFSPTSVMEGPSTSSNALESVTNSNDVAEGGTLGSDSTAASCEKGRRDSLLANSNSTSSTGEDSSKKHQNQFSEVERRLSRANKRLSRSITQKDNTNKRRSRSRSRSTESKGFFAALVENARSRSNSRTRQRSSRSVTREGGKNTNKEEKEVETRHQSRSKSGGDDSRSGKKQEARQRSRSRSVKPNGRGESIHNKQEKRRSRSCSRTRSVATKDGTSRERSRSTAKESGENTSMEEKKNAGGNRSRSGSPSKKNLEASKEDFSGETASKDKTINDDKDLSIKDDSSSRPNQLSSDPSKMMYLPDPHSMTVKALQAELNLFKVNYSSFNEKEQFIAAVRHSRETSERSQFETTSMKLKALKGELAIYEVDYSNFREKSEFMEALRNARETEPECAQQQTEVSSQEGVNEELTLNVNHREPITHPRYKLGDVARDEDMIIFPAKSRSRSGRGRRRRGQDGSETSSADEDQDNSNQSNVTASVMELQHLDAAFIRRSDGRWTYALVADGDDKGIRFVLNQQGATKILTKEKWKKNVRRIKVLTQRKGDVLKVNDKPTRRRRDRSMRRSLSKTKRRGRLASPSPTRNYRYRRVDTLSVPPTITEGKVFMPKGVGRLPEPGLKRRRQYSQAAGVLPEWAHLWKEDI